MTKYLVVLALVSTAAMAKPPAATLYPIVWQWMWGKADSSYRFNDYGHFDLIANLKNAHQVKRAREFWYAKNMQVFKAGDNHWLPMDSFLGRFQTIRGVIRSNTDMVEQTIGGFTVHIHPIGSDSLRYTVYDVKSRWSFFWHLPFIGNRPFIPGKHRQKLMAEMKWYFVWTEPINRTLFHRRELNTKFYNAKKYTGVGF